MSCDNEYCFNNSGLTNPCKEYVRCVCRWPQPFDQEHCDTCQHTLSCHELAVPSKVVESENI